MIIFSRFYDRSRDKQSKSGIIFPYCTVFFLFFLIRPKYLLSFSKKNPINLLEENLDSIVS